MKSEWARFCVFQGLDFIGSSHKGSSSTVLNVSVSGWDKWWFDCIIWQISTFIIYFY